jgi:glutathione S-transferase
MTLTFYDYLPSQNCYKVRLLLSHLRRPYRTKYVSIFEGEGQELHFLRINPMGAVPAIELDDGRYLAESNAILCFLAEGTPYLPGDPYERAKTLQWLFFERSYISPSIATLRYWTLTGKLDGQQGLEGRRAIGQKALAVLDQLFTEQSFAAGAAYTVADMSLFAYTHLAGEAGLPLAPYPGVRAWVERVRSQPHFLAEIHPYSIDPHSSKDLP